MTSDYLQSRVLYLYPDKDTTIKDSLVHDISKLTKACISCNSNTVHEETIKVELPPDILTIVINRFGHGLLGAKNKYNIHLDSEILVASDKYILIGSIHHHGNTVTSGHYTSNIFYPDSAYICNDNHITPLTHFEASNSVYIAFYKRQLVIN